MGRSKLKRPAVDEPSEDTSKVPIENLPKKLLWMHVNSGTKIRNVLGYALLEFPNRPCILWSGAGQGIGKVITCAELFKKKNTGLHQLTKLCYVESRNSSVKETHEKIRRVPEIHILLSRDSMYSKESGYQAPNNSGTFWDVNNEGTSEGITETTKIQSNSKMSNKAAEEFTAMGLRMGQKRPRKEQQTETPSKKNKKKDNGNQSKI
ncbi:ribonuclease P protein subunit p25-like protein [Cephus cinctus]|uniref:Ribonuclease P protein subunit p25-like protein n=1 Tax=Cephus cinctus TaxID=211228 RepID=A0AAJ7FJ90_CEPCN|nr:ribonuclease P protein subunit p25-like protein [Cephus cinctus]